MVAAAEAVMRSWIFFVFQTLFEVIHGTLFRVFEIDLVVLVEGVNLSNSVRL